MPRKIGRYVCDDNSFTSGDVSIWRCKDDRERKYVIESVIITPENEYALMREIRILEKITSVYQDPSSRHRGGCHPGITCLRDHYRKDGRMYLVFEHFDGIELSRAMNIITCSQARIVFRYLGEALLFLHSHGIAHENLSADTVGFSEDEMRIELVSFESACIGGGCSENSFQKDKLDWLALGSEMSKKDLGSFADMSIEEILARDPLGKCDPKRGAPKSMFVGIERRNSTSRLATLPKDIIDFFVAPMVGEDQSTIDARSSPNIKARAGRSYLNDDEFDALEEAPEDEIIVPLRRAPFELPRMPISPPRPLVAAPPPVARPRTPERRMAGFGGGRPRTPERRRPLPVAGGDRGRPRTPERRAPRRV